MAENAGVTGTGLNELIIEIRRSFRLLAGISDKMLERRGLTASLRAVLEYLADNGPVTVPRIAAVKTMTRQSVQALTDRLQGLGLVETRPNPEHKRSVLIELTAAGEATFQSIRAEEAEILGAIAVNWPDGEVPAAIVTLRAFQGHLSKWKETVNVQTLKHAG